MNATTFNPDKVLARHPFGQDEAIRKIMTRDAVKFQTLALQKINRNTHPSPDMLYNIGPVLKENHDVQKAVFEGSVGRAIVEAEEAIVAWMKFYYELKYAPTHNLHNSGL